MRSRVSSTARRAAAGLALAALGGACGNDNPGTSARGAVSERAAVSECERTSEDQVPIELNDRRFRPACVLITPRQTLLLRNSDSVEHNFTVNGTRVNIDIEPGAQHETAEFDLLSGGYSFYCKYHRKRGMTGEIRLTE